jgi:hypothetical protein
VTSATLSGKRNVGKTLTILILFLVIVVIILVIFGYFTGLINLSGGASHNVNISGVFALDPNNSSAGTLAISITNLSGSPITSVALACSLSDFASASCDNLVLVNNNGPISAQNSINTNMGASGSALVGIAPGANIQTGASRVSVSVNLAFADGSSKSILVMLTTQE